MTTRRDARTRSHDVLADEIRACRRCKGMNILGKTQAAPGFGSLQSPVVIVGQSLCGPCMKEQEPFFGGCGEYLSDAIKRARRKKTDLYITNVVHCHPPGNRKSEREWIDNCSEYLHRELRIVRPRLVIGLGQDAHKALRSEYPGIDSLPWPFKPPRAALRAHAGIPVLVFAPHPGSFRWEPKAVQDQLIADYVRHLTSALRWGFAHG